jgi:hypothetical protein
MMAIFWFVVPCSLVEAYQHFRGAFCLHHQNTATQKTAIFILAAVRTSNLTTLDQFCLLLYAICNVEINPFCGVVGNGFFIFQFSIFLIIRMYDIF